MTTVRVIKLDDVRPEGERRIPYKAIYIMAESLNTSNYLLPGPKGYLSPSTISKWRLCPQSVYLEQIMKLVPRAAGLAMHFGQANHEAMAKGFEKYKAHGKFINISEAEEIIKQHLASNLLKALPEALFSDTGVCAALPESVKQIAQEAILLKQTVGIVTFEQVKALLEVFDPEQLNEKFPYKEFTRQGKTMEKFLTDVDKRLADALRFFDKFIAEEQVSEFGAPKDILAIEEDIFVVIDGIPIYFIADLVTTKGVHDWKFTAAGNVEGKREAIPFDVQLWLYELVWHRPAYLEVCAPPAKTSKAKPRPVCVRMGRRDPGQRVLDDETFLENILTIPNNIENGIFEKRGVCFMGNCGACDAYEVCATRQEDIPMVTVDSIGKLTRKKVEFDSAAIKARNKKEAEEATGLECANYEEV